MLYEQWKRKKTVRPDELVPTNKIVENNRVSMT